METNFLIIVLASITLTLSAQNVKKAYKNLEKSDYLKAKEIFEKNLSENKDHVASNFGMAMILADENSPFFNIVDAWQYIVAIDGKTNELTQEEIEILGEYFLATEVRRTSYPVKKKIENAQEAVESRLIKYIREENDLEAVYAVLEKYPDYRHYDNVIHIRNQFEFRKCENTNTKAGYDEFIQKFPDAAQVPKAERYRNKMAFEEAKTQNTVLSYNTYIKDYPKSEQLQQAIKLRNEAAFAAAKAKNTLEAYEQFIAFYPDALQIPDARKYQHELMYEKAKRIKSLEAYNQFIRMYPEGAYYIDVFNLKATDLGKQYFQQLGFSSANLKWVKALDNNEQIETAKTMAVTNDGGYIIAGTSKKNDTTYTDAWIVKLAADGKMLWNKTIGQAFNDDVLNVLVTSENQVVVVGYTQVSDDINDRMGWMFLLGEDGTKIWNKNLGKIQIAASAIAPNNKIYLSTYVNDTLQDPFYIQAMNLKGQKVWDRDYVRKGVFNSMKFTNNDNVILSGSKWLICCDPKFYIKWEDTLKIHGNYEYGSFNDNMISVISSDSVNKSFFAYSYSGAKIGSSSIITDKDENIIDMLTVSGNNSVIISENKTSSYLTKITAAGQQGGKKEIVGNLKLVKVIENKSGDISYLLKGKDYVIISFSSIGF
jgi:hypothetical protein